MDATTFLQRMEDRDPGVFDELMRTLRPVALSACNVLRLPSSEREDLVQDVALKVFSNWRSFRADSKLSTWIYAIARNQCLDVLQRLNRSPVVYEPPLADGEDTPEPPEPHDTGLGDPDHRRCIGQVLADLEREPPARANSVRKIEIVRFWIEMAPTTEELAEFLNTTVAAAKERKRYVWAHLRSLCAKHCGTDECGLTQGAQG